MRPSRRHTLLLLATALVAAYAGDLAVGSYASTRVADSIGCRLGSAEVDAEIVDWPRSVALAGDSASLVDVRAEDVSMRGLVVGLRLRLTDVALDDHGLAEAAGRGRLYVPLEQVAERASTSLGEFALEGQDGLLVAEVPGRMLSASAAVRPAVADGRLTLDADGISLADRNLTGEVSDDQLARLLAGRAGPRLGTAFYEGIDLSLPAAVSVTDVTVRGNAVELEVELAPGGVTQLLALHGGDSGCDG